MGGKFFTKATKKQGEARGTMSIAETRNRTGYLRITSAPLCHMSYLGKFRKNIAGRAFSNQAVALRDPGSLGGVENSGRFLYTVFIR